MLIEDQNKLKEASEAEKKELNKRIKTHQKIIKNLSKDKEKSRKSLLKAEAKIIDGQEQRKYLAQHIDDLNHDMRNQTNSHLYNLKKEREKHEKILTNRVQHSSEIINELLEQQEIDQAKPWWKNLQIFSNIDFSVNSDDDGKKEPAKERESHFYPSWSTDEMQEKMLIYFISYDIVKL